MKYRILRKGIYSDYEGSYKFQWKDLIRWAIHLPIGAIIAYLVMRVDPMLGLTAGLFFLAYEALEDFRVADRSFKDVFGALIMLIVAGFVIKIWF